LVETLLKSMGYENYFISPWLNLMALGEGESHAPSLRSARGDRWGLEVSHCSVCRRPQIPASEKSICRSPAPQTPHRLRNMKMHMPVQAGAKPVDETTALRPESLHPIQRESRKANSSEQLTMVGDQSAAIRARPWHHRCFRRPKWRGLIPQGYPFGYYPTQTVHCGLCEVKKLSMVSVNFQSTGLPPVSD
jgi:hypothetical protein